MEITFLRWNLFQRVFLPEKGFTRNCFSAMVRPMRYIALLFTVCMLILGCEDKIGDSCSRDMDCSPNGDRSCDNTQPGGYCLIVTCSPDECPDEAACTEFTTPSPVFDTDDADAEALYEQLAPNRTRTYCLAKCKKNADCRSGYHCALDVELDESLDAMIIDSNYVALGVCVPN